MLFHFKNQSLKVCLILKMSQNIEEGEEDQKRAPKVFNDPSDLSSFLSLNTVDSINNPKVNKS